MTNSKLNLDKKQVADARGLAKNIAGDVQKFVDNYTTTTVERTICRLLDIDGIDQDGVPLPNVVVDHLVEKGILNQGVMYYLGNAIIETKLSLQEIAEQVANKKIDLSLLPAHSKEDVQKVIEPLVNISVEKIANNRKTREEYIERLGEGPKPYLYYLSLHSF